MTSLEIWLRDEVQHLGLRWRQANVAGDSDLASFLAGKLDALGDVWVVAKMGDADEVGRLIDEAKGTET